MSKEKISSHELVNILAAKANVSKKNAEEFVKVFFAVIEEALQKGESVKVKNLGTFKPQWNASRKSVNVQTGEEIVLPGYYKVSFTPDLQLKNIVNEPYAHLESVILDDVLDPLPDGAEEDLDFDSLNFEEQANEIKDLLSDLKTLSFSGPIDDMGLLSGAEEAEELAFEEEVLINAESILYNELDATLPEITHAELVVPVEKESVGNNPMTEGVPVEEVKIKEEVKGVDTESHSEEVSSKTQVSLVKKRKVLWVYLLVLVVLMSGTATFFYYTSSCFSCWLKYDVMSIENKQKLNHLTTQLVGFFHSKDKEERSDSNPNALPKKKVVVKVATPTVKKSTEKTEKVDSLQLLFDSERVYKEYLGTAVINEGSTLTRVAEKYYGSRDFWVYIYEANKLKLGHPDRIPTGTTVRIPKVDSRLIDANNPRCIAKAKALRDQYVGDK